MTCQPEWVTAAYADGELDASRARSVETHLIHCERCRRRVLALRDEARVLGDALRGALHPSRAPAPARATALGLPLSIALAVGIATVAGFILDARLPQAIAWLHPARTLGVSDMFWNTMFLLQDERQGLLELAVGVGVVAGLAALGSFLVSALARRITGGLAAALLALLLSAPAADAAVVLRDDDEQVHLARDERVDGLFFATSELVTIDGVVAGDAVISANQIEVHGVIEGNLIAAGEELEITGTVAGNLILAGRNIDIESPVQGSLFVAAGKIRVAEAVQGSLFAAGEHLHLDAPVAKSATVAAEHFALSESGAVGRDLVVFADQTVLDGQIARDLIAYVETLQISGSIERDGTIHAEDLHFTAGAKVGGEVALSTPDESAARVDEGAVIAGGIRFIEWDFEHEPRSPFGSTHFYLWRVVWLAGAFGVGLILYLLLPGLFQFRIRSGSEFALTLVTGAASLPVVLAGCIFLVLTVVGIPLAILTLLLYLVAGYLAFLAVAVLLGRHITKPQSERLREFGLALLAGLLVVTVLVNLPIIGDPAWWVLLCLGFGLLALRAREAWLLRRALATEL